MPIVGQWRCFPSLEAGQCFWSRQGGSNKVIIKPCCKWWSYLKWYLLCYWFVDSGSVLGALGLNCSQFCNLPCSSLVDWEWSIIASMLCEDLWGFSDLYQLFFSILLNADGMPYSVAKPTGRWASPPGAELHWSGNPQLGVSNGVYWVAAPWPSVTRGWTSINAKCCVQHCILLSQWQPQHNTTGSAHNARAAGGVNCGTWALVPQPFACSAAGRVSSVASIVESVVLREVCHITAPTSEIGVQSMH